MWLNELGLATLTAMALAIKSCEYIQKMLKEKKNDKQELTA